MSPYHWDFSTPEQVLGMIGSVLILGAYMLTVTRPEKLAWYCSISLAGGLVLFVVALIYHNLGLIVLEVFWVLINAWGLWRAYRLAG